MQEVETAHVGVGDAGERDGARIIHHDVDAAEMRRSAFDRLPDGVFLTDVNRKRERLPAGRLDLGCGGVNGAGQLGMRRLGLRCDRDVGAVARGAQRHRKSDSARRAGDEERLALKGHLAGTPE